MERRRAEKLRVGRVGEGGVGGWEMVEGWKGSGGSRGECCDGRRGGVQAGGEAVVVCVCVGGGSSKGEWRKHGGTTQTLGAAATMLRVVR
jgi:hypothetical protein